jgi:hypothetical protein
LVPRSEQDFSSVLDYLSQHWEYKVALKFIDITDVLVRQISIKVCEFTEIDENKCFKDLRTTYISRHRAEFGDLGLTATVSDHSNPKVVDKHYYTQIDARKKSKDLRIFPAHEVCVNYVFRKYFLTTLHCSIKFFSLSGILPNGYIVFFDISVQKPMIFCILAYE